MTEPERPSLRPFLPTLALIALFSTFVNLLMLTGPLFMLQVYDRVLSSRSEATLLVLFLLVVGLYGAMGLLDFVRSRIGARIGARLQEELDAPVFKAMLKAPASVGRQAISGLSDIVAVRRFFGAPVAFALFDLPFTPLFVAAIFIFHPMLGWLAVAGGGVLVTLSLINQLISRKPSAVAGQTASVSNRTAEQIRTQPETIRALGMTDAAIARWQGTRDRSLNAEVALSDRNGGFGSVTKALRLFLQSAMLALGAWLVLQDQLTAGAMIAASILLGRALAPIEQLIGGWSVVARARSGWASLKTLLAATSLSDPKTKLNRPEARLDVKGLTVMPPTGGKPIIQQVSFAVSPGQALGIIGESASGKSTIGRVLTGLWLPSAGSVCLDGATLHQFSEIDLASYVGYLPQEVALFDGTIAENIARLQTDKTSEAVIAAAEKAGAHDMILGLPAGYDTVIGAVGTPLSGGQKQRIGLARALYGDPVVLVLDEPNANLDAPGSAALNAAIQQIKARGGIVIVMAHRPAAISECDLLLMMKQGRVADFGPRDDVLRKNVRNHAHVASAREVS